jgi:Bacteriocin-protection, YdeI or OmpD-Associated/Domain of unknown function (DUF1905)
VPKKSKVAYFSDKVRKPADSGAHETWGFVLVPRQVSEVHLRRGRLTVNMSVNDVKFNVLLEPDGHLGHWFMLSPELMSDANLSFADEAHFVLETLDAQPSPKLPSNFANALADNPIAQATWDATTTLAQIDWVHWIETAKQADTKLKRIENAIEMLAKEKKRVCCFDPSGFYSKALAAPPESSQ